jgi:outer membrane protein
MKRIKNGFVIVLLCVSNSVSAQKVWTLEDCIRYAMEHNISIKQLVIQKNNSEVNLNTAKMSLLPDLNATAGQNWNFGRTQTQSGMYENQTQSNTNFSVGTSIALFDGFRIPNEIAKNKLELEFSLQNLEKAKEDLALNITMLFLQVLFNQELLKISQEQLRLSESQIDQTRNLAETGKVPLSQLYDIEAQVANDKVLLVQSENNLRMALLDLSQSIELEQNTNFNIVAPAIDNMLMEYTGTIQTPQTV